MKILNGLKKFLGIGEKSPAKEIKLEDGTTEAPRMRTGNSNGILSIHERNLLNGKQKKASKSRKKRKLANQARNAQHAH